MIATLCLSSGCLQSVRPMCRRCGSFLAVTSTSGGYHHRILTRAFQDLLVVIVVEELYHKLSSPGVQAVWESATAVQHRLSRGTLAQARSTYVTCYQLCYFQTPSSSLRNRYTRQPFLSCCSSRSIPPGSHLNASSNPTQDIYPFDSSIAARQAV